MKDIGKVHRLEPQRIDRDLAEALEKARQTAKDHYGVHTQMLVVFYGVDGDDEAGEVTVLGGCCDTHRALIFRALARATAND